VLIDGETAIVDFGRSELSGGQLSRPAVAVRGEAPCHRPDDELVGRCHRDRRMFPLIVADIPNI